VLITNMATMRVFDVESDNLTWAQRRITRCTLKAGVKRHDSVTSP
jgi:hypothetical protein